MVQKQKYMNFDAFICHETTTAHKFASHLKESLRKMGINAFVAPEDIDVGEADETNIRYKTIEQSPHFIIIMTPLGLTSTEEVKKEIKKALDYNNKTIVICLHNNVDKSKFEETFPELAKMQRLKKPFNDEYDLANEVTSWFSNNLIQKEKELSEKEEILPHQENGLIVRPEWSIKKITQKNNIGHIIFELKNRTGKQIIIHGYRMFRITPNGEKDIYYHKKISDASEFKGWVSNPHIKIILWNNDEHIFHWIDTNIIETYGINKKGKWGTEVWIVYIEAGSETPSYSVGRTYIEFE